MPRTLTVHIASDDPHITVDAKRWIESTISHWSDAHDTELMLTDAAGAVLYATHAAPAE